MVAQIKGTGTSQFDDVSADDITIGGGVSVTGDVSVTGSLSATDITTTNNPNDSGWLVIGETGAPAFQNSWVDYGSNYGETRIRKINGIVHIEGIVRNGSAANADVFYLPVGWRPRQNVIMAGLANNTFGRLQIDHADGAVYYQTGGSTAWQSLWCSFVAHK